MKVKEIAFLSVAIALLLTAPTGCGRKKAGRLLPSVSGKAGEVVVVIDRESWEGSLGTQIRAVLGDDCPYLANREPLFALTNVPPGSFNNMFKMHRNLLLVNLNPQGVSTGMVWKKDQWAAPQAVAQLNAPDATEAIEVVRDNAAQMVAFFEQAERDRIIANAARFEELSLRPAVEELTGGTMVFPSGYRLRKRTDDFLWIADEKQYTNQTVLIYRYPAGKDPFTPENIIAARNAVMKANVPGSMVETMWMTTSTAIEPTFQSLRYHGIDFMETRGFWEITNDYMGGPFVSHSFYTPDGKDVIVLEAFVYAPKYDKRQYLRQVESLLYSFRWKTGEED